MLDVAPGSKEEQLAPDVNPFVENEIDVLGETALPHAARQMLARCLRHWHTLTSTSMRPNTSPSFHLIFPTISEAVAIAATLVDALVAMLKWNYQRWHTRRERRSALHRSRQ